ncbi:DUF4167 domain-containing protein [Rubellimicrobium sp. CFH 75288]|uniref:DUF4167 domain-containing protein n=1 Tax=Rubellimicrobium sp. CFH 75288 TaxID=2697034 RepID=UPI0014124EDA|nr:DUF4167 domain-containing protein [Rubellimicrobium sp. CFH 75288]NAZ35414.1 DUF4167 domain-containing protein [Rubellimicrobium sp. CFH 75288]
MRSSKQRQRNKQNRQNRPSGGNIINRVFDSSGPEGKVRGTPAQIIEKYLQLHRDAQLAGDRVGAENFAQHAEHYTRLLAEAQRDIERAREEQEQWHRERQAERERQFEASREALQRDRGERDPFAERRPEERRADDRRPDERREERRDRRGRHREAAPDGFGAGFLAQPLFPVMVAEPEDDQPAAALVETPEDRGHRPDDQPAPAPAAPSEAATPGTAAEAAPEPADLSAPAAKPARRPRRPRTPKAAPAPEQDAAE